MDFERYKKICAILLIASGIAILIFVWKPEITEFEILEMELESELAKDDITESVQYKNVPRPVWVPDPIGSWAGHDRKIKKLS